MRRFFETYARALKFLWVHRWIAAALCAANLGIAAVGFIEPMLFGHLIEGLSDGSPAGNMLLAWAGLGLVGIAASMATSLLADRLAHRLRLAVMARAYAHVLRLSQDVHARHPNGGLMKTLWTGADEMFGIWLSLFRDYLGTALCLLGLLPVAMFLNPILGSVLVVLGAVFSLTATLTLRRTRGGQRLAESAHTALASQVGDVLGHARLVQAFGIDRRETARYAELAQDVLRHQLPVLSWWAGMTVLSRGASTIATMTILGLGAWLHGRGRASMADVVTFMAFGGMLIGRLDSALAIAARLGAALPRLDDFFALLDSRSAVPDPAGRPARQVPAAARWRSAACPSPIRAARRCCGASTSTCGPARRLHLSAPPGQARARPWPSCSGNGTRRKGRCWSMAAICATSASTRCATPWASCRRRRCC